MKQLSSKEATLASVRELLASGELKPEELATLVPQSVDTKAPQGRSKTLGAALYVVGAIIVCSGLAVLIGQNWSLLDTFSRVLFTFGLGILFLAAGAYLKLSRTLDDLLSETILAVGSVALVIGSGVVTHEFGLPLEESSTLALLAVLLVALNSLLYIVLRSPVVAFTAVAMTVVFIQAFIDALFGRQSTGDLGQYVLMFNGAWLIALGIFIQQRRVLRVISGAIQVFGAIFFLGTAMLLMMSASTSVSDILWPIIYLGLLGLVVYASITAQRKGLLFTASAFLTIYILYVSAEYFSDAFGWPFSLMLAGISIIAIAFGVRKLSSRYFTRLTK